MTFLRFFFRITALLVCGQLQIHPTMAQTCEIHVGESNVDFGQIQRLDSRAANTPGAMHQVGSRFVALNARCIEASRLLLIMRGDSLAAQFRFAEHGQMKVSLSNALLDGRAVDLAQIKALGDVPRAPGSNILVTPGDLIVPVSAGVAAVGTQLSLQIEIIPQLPATEMSTRDSKTVGGNLSLEIGGY